MSPQTQQEARALVEATRALYDHDESAVRLLDELEQRLEEPLRLALAGMVKAGKSTLLNALLGERIAPTDAGECTRVVTWYRYADSPSITLHPREGSPQRLRVRRVDGQVEVDLGEYSADDVDHIDIAWPSRVLQSAILIDTPGIASLSQDVSVRSTTFLAPDDSPGSADAIIYLIRHLHPLDVGFLESFRDTAAGASRTVNAVAVLSRADELGSGRIDSLLSASKVARRYELDGEISALVLGVIPVAGLVAEGARTLRESEFVAFRTLAQLDRERRERLLISADRFVRPDADDVLSDAVRAQLLARFGVFGVRLATSLIRAGVDDSSELAERMTQQSGMVALRDFVERHFIPRSSTLKVRSILEALERLVRERPRGDTTPILAGIERLQLTNHNLRELSLLSQAHASGLPLSDADAAAALRIIGGNGTGESDRLGTPEPCPPEVMRVRVREDLAHWRTMMNGPLIERPTIEVAHVVVRSLEQLAAGLERAGVDEFGDGEGPLPQNEDSEVAADPI